jgi:hypothetical protein
MMKLTKNDLAEFVKAKVPASALRSAGYSASALRSAGYSASALLSAGYSISEVLSAGYSISEVPKLVKPYTTILAGIEAGERVLNQSTFGEKTLEKHVCGTPMCIAGSLVQLAGAKGWELKTELGWGGAATLLHYEAHPDLPHANFGNVGNEVSMIYLRLMAKLEAKQEQG